MDVRTRETWRDGEQVSYEVEAFTFDGQRMRVPRATVVRDQRGPTVGGSQKLTVLVIWGPSGADPTLADGEAQLAVMTKALELAHELAKDLEALPLS